MQKAVGAFAGGLQELSSGRAPFYLKTVTDEESKHQEYTIVEHSPTG